MAEHIHHPKDYKSLEEIWNDLLRLHWDYLDTEENMQKLEMRKTLEGELENFLCIVQHDRKFFLTETANVLKQSIMKTEDFTAYKALIGFEAISLYASNLFRKPWRKEYRCIKMYSGYYQYEVNANLVGAEKLFEAMGYTLLPDQTLVLDGPICPDQVTNVSRDAMAAYVECQIMKQIFLGLTTLQYQTTWQEIFRYREMHIGTAAQAIAGMAYAIHERNYRKQKQLQLENCYASIAPSIACSTACSTSNHHPYNQSANCKHQPVPSYGINSNVMTQTINGMHVPCNAATIYANPQLCSSHNHNHSHAHSHSSHCTTVAVAAANGHKFNGGSIDTATYSVPIASHASIPHSKSLEHYHEAPSKAAAAAYHHHHSYLARHSLDKPPSSNAYDFNGHSYDCLDGASVGHHSDRYALPVHMESHYAQIAPSGNVYDPMPAPPYSHTYATPYPQSRNDCSCSNDHRISANVRLSANDCHNYHPLPTPVCEVHGKMYPKSNNGAARGHGFEPYLINFDDKPINGDGPHDYEHRRHHEPGHVKSHYNQYDSNSKLSSNDKGHSAYSLKYAERNRQQAADYDDYAQNDYVPHSDSKRSSTLKNYARNKKLLGEYEEHFETNDSRNSRQSDFDSFDSANNLSIERELGSRGTVDQTTSSKIRDGVGSYETWNYVFRNIGKNGYNKVSNCDADDLTVQGLDLNAVPTVANEKRRSRNLDANESAAAAAAAAASQKHTNGTGANRKIAIESIAPSNSNVNGAGSNNRKTVSVEVNGMPKSMLKQSAPPPNGIRENGRNQYESNDIGKKSNFKLTNGGTISTMMPNGNGGQSTQMLPTPSTVSSMSSSMRNDTQPPSDEIRSAPNEWSCKFCTFLNPVHLRICQMCFKSQDFVIDVPKASTCV